MFDKMFENQSQWQKDVLANQEAGLANQEAMLGNQATQINTARLGNIINAAGFLKLHGDLRQIHGAVKEQTTAINQQTDVIEQMSRSLNEGLADVSSSIYKVESAIRDTAAIANNQRYAQWRDGTENGQLFHYEYRPAALSHLDRLVLLHKAWIVIVLQRVKREVEAYESWKDPRWREQGIRDGQMLERPALQPPPPQPRDAHMLEQRVEGPRPLMSDENKKTFGCLGIFMIPMMVIGMGVVFVEEPGLVLSALFGFLLLASPFLAYFFFRHKKRRSAESENLRRTHITENYRNAVSEWRNEQSLMMDQWERANAAARREAGARLSQRVGVDLNRDFSELWASEATLAHNRRLSELLSNALENPPARDELVSLERPMVNPSLPDQLRAQMQSVVDTQFPSPITGG